MSESENRRPVFWSGAAALAVLGVGAALPGNPVSTEELLRQIARHFDVDVGRRGAILARRLGIATRHLSRALERRFEGTRPGHTNAELAAKAVERALKQADARISDLAYMIAHTATPGELVPPNIVQVARLLNYAGPLVELRQACTGFANALVFANSILSNRASGLVAIVGSETGSVYFDPLTAGEDKTQLVNLVQMGDGAAALVLGAVGKATSRGLTDVFFGHCGNQRQSGFRLAGGGSDAPAVRLPQFAHEFETVRRQGPFLFEQGAAAARAIGIEPREVDYVIPHQANGHMAALFARHFGIAAERVFVNADRLGNTGSAAIWLAFTELHGRLREGETVLALGAEATGHMFGGFRYVHG
jgi:3-oxoacyl-[acyl-carrier-protein] synthase III